VAACEPCNARKGDRTPENAGMKLRRRPIRPEWKPFYAAQEAWIESWARFVKHEPALVMATA
jgi:5-methylcytosine-specific restriction endonuclease McrA